MSEYPYHSPLYSPLNVLHLTLNEFVSSIVKSCRQDGLPIVVAGCVPQGDRNLPGLEHVSVIGVQNIDRVVEVVEETLKGNVVRLLEKKTLPSLDLPKIRKNQLIEM